MKQGSPTTCAGYIYIYILFLFPLQKFSTGAELFQRKHKCTTERTTCRAVSLLPKGHSQAWGCPTRAQEHNFKDTSGKCLYWCPVLVPCIGALYWCPVLVPLYIRNLGVAHALPKHIYIYVPPHAIWCSAATGLPVVSAPPPAPPLL